MLFNRRHIGHVNSRTEVGQHALGHGLKAREHELVRGTQHSHSKLLARSQVRISLCAPPTNPSR